MATLEEIIRFIATEFPQSTAIIEQAGGGTATVKHRVSHADLRPGGTVSGPVMMGLADVALYVAIFGAIGIVPLAVTTSLSINFLRKPAADRDVVAVCRLLKVGKSLVVGEVSLYSEGLADPVAHAVATYAIPPKREHKPA